MKIPSAWVTRRQQFLMLLLLLSAVLVAVYGLAYAGHVRLPGAQPPSLLQRLNVPQSSDPWEIDAILDGHRVKLALPQELLKINMLPPQTQNSVRQRIEYRRRNIEVLRRAAVALDRVFESGQTVHLASHKQTLEHVVMSLPPLLQGTNPALSLALHEPVLSALPAYTNVDFFLPNNLIPHVLLRLRRLGMEQRVKLHGEPEYEMIEGKIPLRHFTTRWVRDLFWRLVRGICG